MSKKFNDLHIITSDSLNMQRQLFNAGHENSGASIDVYSVILDAISVQDTNPAYDAIKFDIEQALGVHGVDVLKYAKELDPRVVSMIRARVANLAK
ncbi:rIII lysis inhibition accessory protein, rapid lysis phenotype [Aeromonas phage ZPAH1]|nr:hypothetical protein ASwh1_99 [Aeromonas phage Aswh_1]QQG33910.1 rIII lysis inhibition accessory protein, rapid lysis phenotype [Aeromonas phage ZPAH1]